MRTRRKLARKKRWTVLILIILARFTHTTQPHAHFMWKNTGQLVPMSTRTHVNSYPCQLVPISTRTTNRCQLVPQVMSTRITIRCQLVPNKASIR